MRYHNLCSAKEKEIMGRVQEAVSEKEEEHD
jgi:hypothetical protein